MADPEGSTGHPRVSAEEFSAAVPSLRENLLQAQFDLAEAARFPVILLLAGTRTAGRGELARRLLSWFDPRDIVAEPFDAPTGPEKARPYLWRYWQALPAAGRIGVFFGAWYTEIVRGLAADDLSRSDRALWESRLEDVLAFERHLAAEGTLLLKFHLDIDRREQKRRIETLKADKLHRWRITDEDERLFAGGKRIRRIAERVRERSDRPHASWVRIDATDPRYRDLTVGREIVDRVRSRLEAEAGVLLPSPPTPRRVHATDAGLGPVEILAGSEGDVGDSATLDKDAYEVRLLEAQGRVARATRRKAFRKGGLVIVFEGQDAAGKGGAIRRLVAAMDPRRYRIHRVAAPDEIERVHTWLWRFWRDVPARGRVAVFDRSWYGRVLVERIEGFCTEADWRRGYDEIVDFERELVAHGLEVVKFWLDVSREEQLRRFEAREATGYKRHKITPEDWRNREKWDANVAARDEMFARTSTESAPWITVPADDKRAARVAVVEAVAARLEGR